MLGKIIGKFLGNKADRDMQEVTPYVEKVAAEFDQLQGISNDQLRDHSAALKQRIEDYVAEDKASMEEMKKKAEDPEVEVSLKESMYQGDR